MIFQRKFSQDSSTWETEHAIFGRTSTRENRFTERSTRRDISSGRTESHTQYRRRSSSRSHHIIESATPVNNDIRQAEEDWNTSVQEQKRLLEEIQRQRDSSTRQIDSSSRQIDSSTRQIDSSTRQRDSSTRRRETSTRRRSITFRQDHYSNDSSEISHQMSHTIDRQTTSIFQNHSESMAEESVTKTPRRLAKSKTSSCIVDRILGGGSASKPLDCQVPVGRLIDYDQSNSPPDIPPLTSASTPVVPSRAKALKRESPPPSAVTRPSRRRSKKANMAPEPIVPKEEDPPVQLSSVGASIVDQYLSRRSSNPGESALSSLGYARASSATRGPEMPFSLAHTLASSTNRVAEMQSSIVHKRGRSANRVNEISSSIVHAREPSANRRAEISSSIVHARDFSKNRRTEMSSSSTSTSRGAEISSSIVHARAPSANRGTEGGRRLPSRHRPVERVEPRAPSLRRQDSFSNLNSLQDDIRSLLREAPPLPQPTPSLPSPSISLPIFDHRSTGVAISRPHDPLVSSMLSEPPPR